MAIQGDTPDIASKYPIRDVTIVQVSFRLVRTGFLTKAEAFIACHSSGWKDACQWYPQIWTC